MSLKFTLFELSIHYLLAMVGELARRMCLGREQKAQIDNGINILARYSCTDFSSLDLTI